MKIAHVLLPMMLVVIAQRFSLAAIVPGGDTTGLVVEDFQAYTQDVPLSTLDNNALGIHFGEKFLGQANNPVGDFDIISDVPIVPLTLDSAVDPIFGVVVYPRVTLTIGGLGPAGHPAENAIPEGSLAVLFDVDQIVIGFDVANFDNDQNSMDIQFFSRSGALLADLTVLNPQLGPHVFTSTGDGIAAIVIDNAGTNTGGTFFDNFRFQPVPEPSALALAIAAIASIAVPPVAAAYRRFTRTGTHSEA